jgi:hypothetical protein
MKEFYYVRDRDARRRGAHAVQDDPCSERRCRRWSLRDSQRGDDRRVDHGPQGQREQPQRREAHSRGHQAHEAGVVSKESP